MLHGASSKHTFTLVTIESNSFAQRLQFSFHAEIDHCAYAIMCAVVPLLPEDPRRTLEKHKRRFFGFSSQTKSSPRIHQTRFIQSAAFLFFFVCLFYLCSRTIKTPAREQNNKRNTTSVSQALIIQDKKSVCDCARLRVRPTVRAAGSLQGKNNRVNDRLQVCRQRSRNGR